jgi:DNA-binding NtrC family response regulator
MAYDWPGNVRELENCIERCCAMNSGPVIGTADLPGSIRGAAAQRSNRGPDGRIAPRSGKAGNPRRDCAVKRGQADGCEAARHR